MSTNAPLPEPKPPHEGVGPTACRCGATYASWHPGVTFAQGCQLVRLVAGDRHECGGGGYRSRRAVLWAMRVLKLRAWYTEHATCAPDVTLDAYSGTLRDGLTGREVF